MKFTSKSLIKVLACTVVALGAISMAQAADDVNPSGTWTWTGGGRAGGGGGGGRARGGMGTNILVLNYVDGTLTGTLQAPAGGRGGRRAAPPADGSDATPPPAPPAPKPVSIKDAKFDAATATVSFTTTRPGRGGGDPITISYKGKIADGKITGTITIPNANGDPQERPWTATMQPKS